MDLQFQPGQPSPRTFISPWGFYNTLVLKWLVTPEKSIANIDNFVAYDDTKISWSSGLKQKLKSGQMAEFSEAKLRHSLYRPFTESNLYFDRMMNERVREFPSCLPTIRTEMENKIICVSGIGSSKPFHTLVSSMIPSLDLLEKTQCFPFYTYNEDGTNRQENITDWALAEFRDHYNDDSISKWDIFHYNYGLLHHPAYREKYEMNLKRDLHISRSPRTSGSLLRLVRNWADLHVSYESAPKYDRLKYIETPGMPIDWNVEKMRLSKDKTQLKYNDFLTLDGIPPEVYEYRLGNRSALEWVVESVSCEDRQTGVGL